MPTHAIEFTIARNMLTAGNDESTEEAFNDEIDRLQNQIEELGWTVIDSDLYDADGFR